MSHDEKAGCTTVSYLETVDCKDPASVAALLERAARQRAVGATASNERSSRSHMVFTLSVRGSRSSDGQQLNGDHRRPPILDSRAARAALEPSVVPHVRRPGGGYSDNDK